jgi:hypothetical protein
MESEQENRTVTFRNFIYCIFASLAEITVLSIIDYSIFENWKSIDYYLLTSLMFVFIFAAFAISRFLLAQKSITETDRFLVLAIPLFMFINTDAMNYLLGI